MPPGMGRHPLFPASRNRIHKEPKTEGDLMVPRTGVTVDICPREVPIALIGTAGGALALWADAPAEIAVPVALLIVLDIRIRRWSRGV